MTNRGLAASVIRVKAGGRKLFPSDQQGIWCWWCKVQLCTRRGAATSWVFCTHDSNVMLHEHVSWFHAVTGWGCFKLRHVWNVWQITTNVLKWKSAFLQLWLCLYHLKKRRNVENQGQMAVKWKDEWGNMRSGTTGESYQYELPRTHTHIQTQLQLAFPDFAYGFTHHTKKKEKRKRKNAHYKSGSAERQRSCPVVLISLVNAAATALSTCPATAFAQAIFPVNRETGAAAPSRQGGQTSWISPASVIIQRGLRFELRNCYGTCRRIVRCSRAGRRQHALKHEFKH